jgi:hypothetical protein
MSLFYSNIALMIHVERLITSSLPRHVCIPRHISPILPRTSSPTSKGPYRKSLSFSMSSFGPWLSELFIRFNTPKSPNTPSKTGRLLNGALQKVHCSSNQSQFFFAAVKKFIEACRNNFAILGTCLKKKPSCYILPLQIHLRESPFLDKASELFLHTQAKDCVIRQHNNAQECKEKHKTLLTLSSSPPSSSTLSIH